MDGKKGRREAGSKGFLSFLYINGKSYSLCVKWCSRRWNEGLVPDSLLKIGWLLNSFWEIAMCNPLWKTPERLCYHLCGFYWFVLQCKFHVYDLLGDFSNYFLTLFMFLYVAFSHIFQICRYHYQTFNLIERKFVLKPSCIS